MKIKLPPIDPNVIIDEQKQEIKELKSKIYKLQVDNEYLKLKLADTQIFTLIELVDEKDRQIRKRDEQIMILTEKLKTRQEIIDKMWEDTQ